MKHMVFGSVLLLLLVVPARAQDPADEDLVEPVRKAINRGVKFLRSKHNNGDWENSGYPANPGGVTALAVLALLNSGVPVDDPVIQAGLKYLRDLPPNKTYVVSLQTMALALAKQPEFASARSCHRRKSSGRRPLIGDHKRIGDGRLASCLRCIAFSAAHLIVAPQPPAISSKSAHRFGSFEDLHR